MSFQMTQFVPLLWLSNIPLYCTHISHLLCPFVCPWTFRLLPHPSCGKECFSEHWGTHILWNCGFLWVQAQ